MANRKFKTIFFGTPEFAVPALRALAASEQFEVVGVVTQPDRPVGRKKIITPPPVKTAAVKLELPVTQPERLKDPSAQDQILAAKPELAVVVAYGNLIPKRMLDAVSRGFVNIHPSLLPKYRGPSPLTAAILAGDRETGVCLMVLDEQIDHGPVIACRKITLDGDETTASLGASLASLGAEMIGGELIEYLEGKIKAQEQNHDAATFSKLIKTDDFKIDWTKPGAEIERLVRAGQGLTPGWSRLEEKTIMIHRARFAALESVEKNLTPGILTEKENNLAVVCTGGYLLLDEVQMSGGKPMSGWAFLNGHKNLIGRKLT